MLYSKEDGDGKGECDGSRCVCICNDGKCVVKYVGGTDSGRNCCVDYDGVYEYGS